MYPSQDVYTFTTYDSYYEGDKAMESKSVSRFVREPTEQKHADGMEDQLDIEVGGGDEGYDGDNCDEDKDVSSSSSSTKRVDESHRFGEFANMKFLHPKGTFTPIADF